MGSFGNVLKKFRERKNISKVKLGKNIGTSDAYIRQIENQGYKPPTFELCEKICFELSLNESEKRELLESAFIERISSEEKFYLLLKGTIFKTTHLTKTRFVFHFQALIFNSVNNNLDKIKLEFIRLLEEQNVQAENIAISGSQFSFEAQLDNQNSIKISEKFLEHSSLSIKNNFDNFESVPSIWQKNITIQEPLDQESNTSHTLEYAAQL